MKLLFDQNLSHKLVARLADVFPGSTQARLVSLARSADTELWFHARTHQFVLVTKDNDFAELALVRGAPPKVVWLRLGNCSSEAVERLLRANAGAIEELGSDPDRAILELFDV